MSAPPRGLRNRSFIESRAVPSIRMLHAHAVRMHAVAACLPSSLSVIISLRCAVGTYMHPDVEMRNVPAASERGECPKPTQAAGYRPVPVRRHTHRSSSARKRHTEHTGAYLGAPSSALTGSLAKLALVGLARRPAPMLPQQLDGSYVVLSRDRRGEKQMPETAVKSHFEVPAPHPCRHMV